ncbi:MAG: DNA translocase FtsK [Eubacterium sp.]|nr:DNA translocase FtsK [Eubacterium sp.]MBQ9022610.1 DNA translocase FtsK [Eubacterium sp.]
MASTKRKPTTKNTSGQRKSSARKTSASHAKKSTRSTSASRSTAKKSTTSGRSTSAKKKQTRQPIDFPWTSELILFAVLAICILIFIGNLGMGGVVGTFFRTILFGLVGVLSWVFPIWLFFACAFMISNKNSAGEESARRNMKLIAALLLLIFVCTFAHLVCFFDQPMRIGEIFKTCGQNHAGGGIVGGIIGKAFLKAFGTAGAFILTVIILLVSVMLLTEKEFFGNISKKAGPALSQMRSNRAERRAEQKIREERRARELEREEAQYERDDYAPSAKERRTSHKQSGVTLDTLLLDPQKATAKVPDEPERKVYPPPKINIADDVPAAEDQPVSDETTFADLLMPTVGPKDASVKRQKTVAAAPETDVSLDAAYADIAPEAASEGAQEEKQARRRTVKNPVSSAEDNEKVSQEIAAASAPVKKYVFPTTRHLARPDQNAAGDSRKHLEEMSARLQMTLTNFGVAARVTNVTCGPSVTRYEIQPEMGVKVSKITNLADDIKLNLAVSDIRIEAPIPGKAAIGIEVPNKKNVTVTFRELVESEEFAAQKSRLTFCVGKDIGGKIILADIAKMPHVLIAGATGSGKSVCINTIIMSVLYKAKPEEVRMIMIDPKVVELSIYNGIPHLLLPVVTDPKKAAGALNWAVAEMTDRYRKFAEYQVKDIKAFNQKVDAIKDIPGEKPERMPQILIIVDELADLMMVAPGDVEGAICRLAQLARAAGIHLVIATQRPSVNVITGLIKANMPSRIAFAVTSGVDSRTILDMVGAEKLLGKGDMLFYPQDYQKPLRVQGAFISEKEINEVVKEICEKNGNAEYGTAIQEQMEKAAGGNAGGSVAPGKERDVYFDKAGRFVIEKEKGSIGMLQRMFKIGFNRAARIMDQLEEAGVVGPEEGTKPRQVLMSAEEFEAYLSEIE